MDTVQQVERLVVAIVTIISSPGLILLPVVSRYDYDFYPKSRYWHRSLHWDPYYTTSRYSKYWL